MKLSFYILFTFALTFALVKTKTISNGKSIAGRIIGGNTAKAGEFPFAAAISIHTNSGSYFCGGSLISSEYVLTAAQCVDGALRFTISLGADNLQESNPNRVTVAAEEHFINPNYNASNLQHDIALIKLRMPVEFSDYVRPINLPTEALTDHTVVVAIGWGQINDDNAANVADLYRVTITTLTNEECRNTYGATAIIDEMVCAEGNYNEGTCRGDSGGPLVRYRHDGQVLVAVSSFFSGNGCESTDPSGFTRTYPYVDWIKNVTGIA